MEARTGLEVDAIEVDRGKGDSRIETAAWVMVVADVEAAEEPRTMTWRFVDFNAENS